MLILVESLQSSPEIYANSGSYRMAFSYNQNKWK